MTAAIRLLSLWRDPPDWIVWARPAEAIKHGIPVAVDDRSILPAGVDLVITIDVGESRPETSRPGQTTVAPARDYGIVDVGVGVRWYDERRVSDVATFALTRDAEGVTPWMTWLRDVRRDLRRRAPRDGYERARGIMVLWARDEGGRRGGR